jgi:hypothetical protein
VASALISARSWAVCAVVRRTRTRYSESVRSGQRDGSVERVVCGSKEVACEASKCAVAVSVDVGDDDCGGGGSAAVAVEGG